MDDLVTLARRWSRRRFLLGVAVLGVAAGCSLLTSRAWQPTRVPRIGFLATGARPGRQLMIDGLLEGLHERGYEEGRNILIEYRFSDEGQQPPARARGRAARRPGRPHRRLRYPG